MDVNKIIGIGYPCKYWALLNLENDSKQKYNSVYNNKLTKQINVPY